MISLNPLLSLSFVFLRVPEVHDGFEYKLYTSRTTSVADAIHSVSEELGLTKSLPIPGAGSLEYVIEEAWIDGSNESVLTFLRIQVIIFDN